MMWGEFNVAAFMIAAVGILAVITVAFFWIQPNYKSTASLQIEQARLTADATIEKRREAADDERFRRLMTRHMLGLKMSAIDLAFLRSYDRRSITTPIKHEHPDDRPTPVTPPKHHQV